MVKPTRIYRSEFEALRSNMGRCGIYNANTGKADIHTMTPTCGCWKVVPDSDDMNYLRLKRLENLKASYKRERQIMDSSGYISYGVLKRIERSAGIELSAGWSGSFEELASLTRIEEYRLADMFRRSVEELEGLQFTISA